MTRLVIQTNLSGERHLWLTSADGMILRQHHARHQHHAAHLLLVNIERLRKNIRIDQIVVVRGPGPFTAIRAALVTANTLGWIWNIPVRGVVRKSRVQKKDLHFTQLRFAKKYDRSVRPWYGRAPNISKTKPRQRVRQFRRK